MKSQYFWNAIFACVLAHLCAEVTPEPGSFNQLAIPCLGLYCSVLTGFFGLRYFFDKDGVVK